MFGMSNDPEFRDGIGNGIAPGEAPRGRGAALNPGNRFEAVRLHVLGDYIDHVRADADADPRRVVTTVYQDHGRTAINRVDPNVSPEMGFSWTINPYRGCEHGCSYCYARPYHEYLGFSSGLDFETKIVAKTWLPEQLERELADSAWKPETIVMSGITDSWQPIEEKLRITRGCLEVLARARQPLSVITKNRLILRDSDLLGELAVHGAVHAAVSLTTLDARLSAKMEPRASSPADRLRTITELSALGIPVTVMTAPIVPGLNDRELPALLREAAAAGATNAGYVLLRLPYQLRAMFTDWLRREFPERAEHVESLIRDTRGGELYRAEWRVRMKGQGEIAEQIGGMFKVFRQRFGLDKPSPPCSRAAFRRPAPDGQMRLFE